MKKRYFQICIVRPVQTLIAWFGVELGFCWKALGILCLDYMIMNITVNFISNSRFISHRIIVMLEAASLNCADQPVASANSRLSKVAP